MQDYIRAILEPRTKSAATLKNRTNYIMQIYRALESDANDLSFLSDKTSVMKLVRSSDNEGTQKTRLFHIAETLKLDKSKAVKPEIKAYYSSQAEKMREPVKKLEDNNVMNAKQKENHISIEAANLRLGEHLRKVFNDYDIEKIVAISDEDFAKWTGKRDKNVYTLAKAIQECLIASLYVWQTALRNDWGSLTITRKIIIPNTGNWLQIKKDNTMFLILNEYKNAKFFGKQKIQLELRVNQLMLIWLKLLERLLETKPINPLYYSISARGKIEWIKNEDTLARQLARISQKIFNRPATINTFRHAHEMNLQSSEAYKRMTQGERREAHAKLLHSLETGQKYNLQRRD